MKRIAVSASDELLQRLRLIAGARRVSLAVRIGAALAENISGATA